LVVVRFGFVCGVVVVTGVVFDVFVGIIVRVVGFVVLRDVFFLLKAFFFVVAFMAVFATVGGWFECFVFWTVTGFLAVATDFLAVTDFWAVADF
jgi:hypothetical protein